MKNIYIIICTALLTMHVGAQNNSTLLPLDTISEIPWVETFNSYNSFETPPEWRFPVTYRTTYFTYPMVLLGGLEIPFESCRHLKMKSKEPISTFAVTPIFNIPLNQLYVEFWAKNNFYSIGTLTIGYMTNPNDTSTFVPLQVANASSDEYTLYQLRPFILLADSVKGAIAFKHNSNWTHDPREYYLDDIRVDTIPFCSAPEPPLFSEITSSSALITWDDPNEYNPLWNLFYREYENDSDNEHEWISIPGVIDSVTLTNLSPNTTYEVRLTAHCVDRGIESVPSEIVGFTTLSGEIILIAPTHTECFNSVPPAGWVQKEGELPASTSANLSSTTTTQWRLEENGCGGNITTPHTAFRTYTNSNALRIGWLISPSINLGQNNNTYQVEFDVELTAWNASYAPNTTDPDDRFAVVISTDNGATWNAAHAIIWNSVDGNEHSFNGLATQQHICIPLVDTEGNPYQGLIKVGLYAESTVQNADNDLHIDNFVINPFVETVTNLTANIENPNTATISWEGDAEQYVIKYREASEEIWIADTTASTEYEINNLASETQYVVVVTYLQDITELAWKQITFTTPVNPCSLPYNILTTSEHSTTLSVTWEGNATSYIVRYRNQNEENWSSAVASTNSFIIGNLIPASIYFVQVRSNCESGDSDWAPENPQMAMTKIPAGIEEAEENELQVYPNPASTKLYVSSAKPMDKIAIYDMYGRMVKTYTTSEQNEEIEIGFLMNGTYILQIEFSDGSLARVKFLKIP